MPFIVAVPAAIVPSAGGRVRRLRYSSLSRCWAPVRLRQERTMMQNMMGMGWLMMLLGVVLLAALIALAVVAIGRLARTR